MRSGVVFEDKDDVVGEEDVKALSESQFDIDDGLAFVLDVDGMSRRAASTARSHAGFILSSIPAASQGPWRVSS
eukprot:CAMPEP_0113255312 /NCGR_PEP_ID=MMETSP0008_2-20120614/14168_1 /TAXON_ID=97485 /ORGANISM="Prymnesium parvum" /LENGTH=73 /DNA_ID=CAMNT_0000103589 /DNA_START=1103 /DNA_END=1324 /DNA_ORIENTATION=- /assembly_acc=CAM_ASM_000153